MAVERIALQSNKVRRGRPRVRNLSETGNRTISVGLDLFLAIARMGSPATVTEIARSVGMSVSRTARYLSSLTLQEFLQKDENTGRYDLGPTAIELSIATAARIDAVRVVLDVMRKLSAETEQVSVLCGWGRDGAVVIRWEYGGPGITLRIHEGLNVSIVTSAAGRIFLAYYQPGKVRAVLQRELRSANKLMAAEKKLSMADIEAVREEVLRHGLARGTASANPAVAALAAPIFRSDGTLSMSLSLVGFSNSLNSNYRSVEARKLKAAAEKLSRLLGAVAGLSGQEFPNFKPDNESINVGAR